MPIEIERRFLLRSEAWRERITASRRFRQSYLSRTPESRVRVRRSDDQATITVKGPHVGLARHEFEYAIPVLHAEYMLRHLCVTPVIEKTRHWVEHDGLTWEVDVYRGKALGLVLAEVELDRTDQVIALPPWIGAEVTYDPRYRSQGIAVGLWREERVPGEPASWAPAAVTPDAPPPDT